MPLEKPRVKSLDICATCQFAFGPAKGNWELVNPTVLFDDLTDLESIFSQVRRIKWAIPATTTRPVIAAIGAHIAGLVAVQDAEMDMKCFSYYAKSPATGLFLTSSSSTGCKPSRSPRMGFASGCKPGGPYLLALGEGEDAQMIKKL